MYGRESRHRVQSEAPAAVHSAQLAAQLRHWRSDTCVGGLLVYSVALQTVVVLHTRSLVDVLALDWNWSARQTVVLMHNRSLVEVLALYWNWSLWQTVVLVHTRSLVEVGARD